MLEGDMQYVKPSSLDQCSTSSSSYHKSLRYGPNKFEALLSWWGHIEIMWCIGTTNHNRSAGGMPLTTLVEWNPARVSNILSKDNTQQSPSYLG